MYCLPSNILSPRNTKRGKNIKKNSLVFTEFIFYQDQEEEEGMTEENPSRHM